MYDVVARAFASHQCDLGSNPGVNAICGQSLLLVLSFALSGVFFFGTLDSPPPPHPAPQKPAFLNSNSSVNGQN